MNIVSKSLIEFVYGMFFDVLHLTSAHIPQWKNPGSRTKSYRLLLLTHINRPNMFIKIRPQLLMYPANKLTKHGLEDLI